ncbi:hypothetical protein BK665_13865 [Pseudomonas frederiksbergensis]|uniref:Uncharacterized protein n=1 Tax=Pseudomonas frederiksbergensis TaxID=104087 RepID=A0A423KJP1_9PSED|nr:hypothetical protein BK665_13865 [Pseudomonas frederiksbergensis]
MDTEKSDTDLAQPGTYQILGTIGENAQGALVIMLRWRRVLLRGYAGTARPKILPGRKPEHCRMLRLKTSALR